MIQTYIAGSSRASLRLLPGFSALTRSKLLQQSHASFPGLPSSPFLIENSCRRTICTSNSIRVFPFPSHKSMVLSRVSQTTRNMTTESTTTPPQQQPRRDFKSLTREYGPIALAVYCTLTFLTFCACFTSISAFDIDAKTIKGYLIQAKSWMGYPPSTDPDAVEQVVEPPKESWLDQLPIARETLTHILLAMGMTKLFVPVKLGLTAGITPIVARRLRGWGLDLGRQGGYKSAVGRVRGELKGRATHLK